MKLWQTIFFLFPEQILPKTIYAITYGRVRLQRGVQYAK